MIRYLLIFTLFATALSAKQQESCYSLQIERFSKSKSLDFKPQEYPKSCGYFSFKYSKAIRCGCYKTKSIAKKESKELLKKYPKAFITSTYKYRFDALQKKRNKVKKVLPKELAPITIAPIAKTQKVVKPKVKTTPTPVVVQAVPESSFLDDITLQGHIDLTSQYYSLRPKEKHSVNITASAVVEVAYEKDDFKLRSKLKAQLDYFDLGPKVDHTDRTYLRFDELYGTYDFEDDQIMIGKNIRFWGALEVRNITNSFNSDELRDDPFESDKLGSWNATYTHYTQSGEFSAIVKFHEQSRSISAFPYVYYYFPQSIPIMPNVELPLIYKDSLKTEKSEFRPSVYFKYSGSTDSNYPLDYAIVFENGYDSQRYYTTNMAADSQSLQTQENAYIVNKFSTFNTLVVGATLLKLEALYTDVLGDEEISDYMHIGLGVEHTLNQFYGDASLGIIAEYYYYDTIDSSKRNDLELFELFQNDLFLGLRYSFNQENDASIIGGTILDTQYDEQVYYLKYETRLIDIFKFNLDYRFIEPSSKYKTAFNLMGRHERISLQMGYYF